MTDELFDQSEGVEALKALQSKLEPSTQRELARLLFCSEGTVSDLYGGKRVGVELASTIERETLIPVEWFGYMPTESQVDRRQARRIETLKAGRGK